MIKRIKQAFNNLNWSKRETDLTWLENSYRRVINLPLTSKNTISVESFEHEKDGHNKLALRLLDRYGPFWNDFIKDKMFR